MMGQSDGGGSPPCDRRADRLGPRGHGSAGYSAIAPDLLSGMGPKGGGDDAARKAIGSLPPKQVTADLNAVVD